MLTKADIQLIRHLNDKVQRSETQLFVVEGAKMVLEAVASDMEVARLYVTDDFQDVQGLRTTNVERISHKEMERISHLKTPTNSLALVRIPCHHFPDEAAADRLLLALDDVQDPGNMGTIIRVADWFGIEDIICSPSTADCYNPKVVQATMGALFRVRIHYRPLPETLALAARAGTPVYGTYLDGENIYSAELSPSGILVMGNEGHGISSPVAAMVTRRLWIPPFPVARHASESLNVATATAITCSEFRRRQQL